jgi:outer membrane lipoprotein SlyB
MIRTVMFISLPLLLMSCANEPIVDRRGVDEARYQGDLVECRSYAYQVDTAGETGKAAAIGVAIGASLGDSHDAEQGAGVGAVAGGAKGFRKAERRKEKVLYNCLKSRGYHVFG